MQRERILVVDDDPTILALCHRILENDGYRVVEAKRGEEALGKLERETFDLLLTDIRLPGLNGLEVAQRLRDRGLELAVITMTGYSNMEMAIQALSLGVEEFLVKPFTIEGLRITVARALEKWRLRRENTRLRTLVPLLQVAQKLAAARNRNQVHELLLDTAGDILGAENLLCLDVSADEQELTVVATRGTAVESLRGTRWTVKQWADAPALLAGAWQVWNENEMGRLPFGMGDGGWIVAARQRAHEKTVALLLAGLPNAPSQSDLDALNLVAAQAAATIENVDLLGEISRAYVNASELEHLKSEFINIAAHELRTPLAVLRGYASLLRDRLQGETRDFAQQVIEQADRLQRIADDMLNLKYLEHGRADLRLERCEIDQVVREVVSAYRPLALEREQHIEMEIAEHSGVVTADRAMLDVMLGSLLSNAIKFSPRRAQVRVAAQGDEVQVILQVQDQGAGLHAEQAARVFDAFYQTENSLTRREGGLGIGLTLTREMVRAHGGKIWVESRLNEGSSFFIALPRAVNEN